ncbi:hypothetical protein AB0G74_14865 [Streptomyces sp. NPDC020875]|uniref:hypothetical protein n=1 Tax=Streptomyces sp. NPDC020875 TaxID=3154898 RepID=UPI00340DF3EB
MRASRALAVAAVAGVAVGLQAPLAVAGGDTRDTGPYNISVHPHAVHPGGTLRITVDGCSRGGTVTSNAFPTARLENRDGRDSRDSRDDGENRDNGDSRDNRDNRDNRENGEGGDNRDSRDNRDNQGGQGGGQGGQGGGRDNGRGGDGAQVAVARVHDRAAPGAYNLAVRCQNGNRVETAEFAVLRGRGARGGLGGSVGPTTAEMAVGGSLAGAAVLGGALVIARRRRAFGETL